MDCWKLLGLTPTVDKKLIKRAYAKNVKLCNPEDYPEEFQQLREAYEEALNAAKKINIGDTFQTPIDEKNADNTQNPATTDLPQPEYTATTPEALAEQFIAKISDLYTNINTRIQYELWKNLIENDIFWQPEVKQRVNTHLFHFVAHHPYLPASVWQLFDGFFLWSEQERELCKTFPEDMVDYVMGKLRVCRWMPEYNNISLTEETPPEVTIDEYLHRREALGRAIDNNDYSNAIPLLQLVDTYHIIDPVLHRLRSLIFLQQDEPTYAINELQQQAGLDPDSIDASLNIGDICWEQSKYAAAVRAYQHALAIDPESNLALRGLALCLLEQGNPLTAKDLLEQALEQCPFDIDVRVQLVRANQQLIDDTLPTLTDNSHDYPLRLLISRAYYDMGNFQRCSETLACVVDRALDSDGYHLLGQSHEKQQELDAALTAFNHALAFAQHEAKNGFDILLCLGKLHIDLKNYDLAVAYLTQALALSPDNADVLHHLAEAYRHKTDYRKSIELSTQAIAITPEHWIYYSSRGLAYFEQGTLESYAKAIEDFDIVLTHQYSLSGAWFDKAYCETRLKHHEDAIASLQKALDYGHDQADVYCRLIENHIGMKDFPLAHKALTALTAIDPDLVNIIYWKAELFRAQGNMAQASQLYQQGASTHSDYYLFHGAAYFLQQEGNLPGAEALLNALLTETPDNAWALLNSCWGFIQTKNWKQASERVEAYLALTPPEQVDPYAHLYQGRCFYYLEEFELAIPMLEQYIKTTRSPHGYSYLSLALFESGKHKAAAIAASTAYELDKNNLDFQQRLQGLTKQPGKKPSLKERLTTAGRLLDPASLPISAKRWPTTNTVEHHDTSLFPDIGCDI
mgnify:CR=1 FL=1